MIGNYTKNTTKFKKKIHDFFKMPKLSRSKVTLYLK